MSILIASPNQGKGVGFTSFNFSCFYSWEGNGYNYPVRIKYIELRDNTNTKIQPEDYWQYSSSNLINPQNAFKTDSTTSNAINVGACSLTVDFIVPIYTNFITVYLDVYVGLTTPRAGNFRFNSNRTFGTSIGWETFADDVGYLTSLGNSAKNGNTYA